MVEAPGDLPDWTNAILLQGVDGDGNLVAVLLDETGQLYAILRGVDGSGDPQTVKVDADGQLYTVLKGASGESVLVDGDGYLSAMLKGIDASEDPQSVKVDSSGQLYTVLQGASGHAVAVDSDGYIVAVLKGQVDSVLTTISVDAAGRIEAFVLDAESQWGDVIQVGNADLAARLGSLQAWDWRGSILYGTDFSGGSGNILKYPDGTGGSITVDPTYWLHGGFSLKLVAGSTATHSALARGILSHPPSTRIGLQACVSQLGTIETCTLELRRWSAGKTYYARLRWDKTNAELQYQNDAGNFVKIRSAYAPGEDEAFNYFKVVCDIDTLSYTRCLFAGYEDDLSDHGLYQVGTGFLDALYFSVEVVGRAGNNDGVWLDHLLVTVNEPE